MDVLINSSTDIRWGVRNSPSHIRHEAARVKDTREKYCDSISVIKEQGSVSKIEAFLFYLFTFNCHTLNPFPSVGRVRDVKGSTKSLPGTRRAFWSHGLGQPSRTASTDDKLGWLDFSLTFSRFPRWESDTATGIEPPISSP